MTVSARTVPIGDFGMIGDTRTAALVAPDGSIDWLCLPRFDSPPVFGRLVGGEAGGWFRIGPDEPAVAVGRRYRGDTATLETSWSVEGGRLVLADSMVAEITGKMLPHTMVVRRVTAEGRPIRVQVEVNPRFGYEREPAGRIRRHRGGLVIERTALALAVTTDADADLWPGRSVSIEVHPGRPLVVVLSASHRTPAFLVPTSLAAAAAEGDEARWQHWSDSLVIASDHRHAVVRSFITLQLLTYAPSGAPVAAPTTSLPEEIGGARNWDYRFAWPRDASIGIAAFLGAGKPKEALGFLAWLLHASRLDRPRLPALFTLHGRPAPQERELNGWPGYAESTPVRIGNGAGKQHQLDGYGWVLDAAWRLAEDGHHLNGETWRTIKAFADQVAETWMLPDAGIWERRDAQRHNVHSKLMGWLALDRAIRIAQRRGWSGRRSSSWKTAAELLAEDIRTQGYDPEMGCYTAAYGSADMDASLLLLPSIGLEPSDSPRVTRTIDAVWRQLGAGGPLLFRYRDRDGMPGQEGAFLPCSFWLVEALARTGRRREAEMVFQELLERAGPLGLYGEEMDPATGEHLGNFPQALTHSTLLQAAMALNERS